MYKQFIYKTGIIMPTAGRILVMIKHVSKAPAWNIVDAQLMGAFIIIIRARVH